MHQPKVCSSRRETGPAETSNLQNPESKIDQSLLTSAATILKRALVLTCVVVATFARADTATNNTLTSLQHLERSHLQAAHAARLRFQSERHTPLNHGVYEDFRAIIHVHAEDAEHTKG